MIPCDVCNRGTFDVSEHDGLILCPSCLKRMEDHRAEHPELF